MALKTDYKDAMFDGLRRYQIIQNEDGSVSIPDMTNYMQVGDRFGANDINETNKAVNKLLVPREIFLPASGWSDTYPYEQTVAVDGITAEDDLRIIGVVHADGNTAEQDKAIDKAAGLLMYHADGVQDGAVTFRAKKRPGTDITVITEGG